MQSMPDEWQGKAAALLAELDERIDWRPKTGRYFVELRTELYEHGGHMVKGPRLSDPLADYQRGRRRIDRRDGF